MKALLGSADPKNQKEAKRARALVARTMRPLSKESQSMPEWAVEEAQADGKRHMSKGWKPLSTIYNQWPKARKAYIAQW